LARDVWMTELAILHNIHKPHPQTLE